MNPASRLPWKTLFPVLGLLLFFSGSSLWASEQVRVIRVIDGDSVVLLISGKEQECRLIGIDAPEWRQAPWGKRARNRLQRLLDQASAFITLETDAERFDQHERLLVYLRDGSGSLVNLKMVEEGYALAFTKRPNVRHATLFRSAEKSARGSRKGIWEPEGLRERPGAFRNRHRKDEGKKR